MKRSSFARSLNSWTWWILAGASFASACSRATPPPVDGGPDAPDGDVTMDTRPPGWVA